jgi:hypothetical protein
MDHTAPHQSVTDPHHPPVLRLQRHSAKTAALWLCAKAALMITATLCAATYLAAPASAAPGDPCELMVRLICAFVPIAPELDRDNDLTNDPVSPGGAPDNPPAAVTDPTG